MKNKADTLIFRSFPVKPLVCFFHRLYLVEAVLDYAHLLERLARCTKDCAAARQDTGKILLGHLSVIALHQPAVTLNKTVDFHFLPAAEQPLRHAAHGRIERLAIPAACQHTDFLHFILHSGTFYILRAKQTVKTEDYLLITQSNT